MTDVRAADRGSLILIVDDNETNLDILQRRLERDGFKVEARNNAEEIEADVAALSPDAILLDWMMPVRNGLEALIALRAHWDSNHLPVIMVTARDESQAVSQAIQAGANDFVSKPIDFKVLNSRLRGVLARRQAVLEQDTHAAELERLVELRTESLQQANGKLAKEVEVRRAAEARANLLARTDILTGMPNRRHFKERLKDLAQSSSDGGFFLIHTDIDRFRSINAVHGPEMGDSVLIEVARRLSQFTPNVELIARTAADEFSILGVPGDGQGVAQKCAQKIRAALKEPMEINGRTIGLSVSIAVSESGPTPCNDTSLLLESDAAMLTVQRDGGDGIALFDEALAIKIREQVEIKSELAVGIPRGEIIPYFQPTVSFHTGMIEGAEVLARWHHPSKGLVSPAVFIPAAEETGLVDDLFWAMLPKACAAAMCSNRRVTIAVNLSPAQILDQWFPHKVLAELARTGFPPRQFEIEMTETALFADIQATRSALTSLRAQGIGVALDDFGVGFSSLSLLRELPISKVKIDRSFVSEILADAKAGQLVQSLIALCKSLDLTVTAEGIEEEAIALKLAEWGCDYGQGFWFARPAPELLVDKRWPHKLKLEAA